MVLMHISLVIDNTEQFLFIFFLNEAILCVAQSSLQLSSHLCDLDTWI